MTEQYGSLSIKTTVLGMDASNNEFWFFKDDPGRLFIKRFSSLEEKKEDDMDVDSDFPYFWYVLDTEEEFEQLLDSINNKGIKEKKLAENLRKIKFQLKFRKSALPAKKPESKVAEGDDEVLKSAPVEEEMKEEE